MQYSIRPAAVRLLNLLIAKPGLTASDIRTQPNITTTPLERLVEQGYVLPRFEPPFWKPGKVKPKKKYYATEKGFTANEFTVRQRYASNT